MSGSSAHVQAAVHTHPDEDDVLVDRGLLCDDPARNVNYTAFVVGSVDHDASSLHALLIFGRARDDT